AAGAREADAPLAQPRAQAADAAGVQHAVVRGARAAARGAGLAVARIERQIQKPRIGRGAKNEERRVLRSLGVGVRVERPEALKRPVGDAVVARALGRAIALEPGA